MALIKVTCFDWLNYRYCHAIWEPWHVLKRIHLEKAALGGEGIDAAVVLGAGQEHLDEGADDDEDSGRLRTSDILPVFSSADPMTWLSGFAGELRVSGERGRHSQRQNTTRRDDATITSNARDTSRDSGKVTLQVWKNLCSYLHTRVQPFFYIFIIGLLYVVSGPLAVLFMSYLPCKDLEMTKCPISDL